MGFGNTPGKWQFSVIRRLTVWTWKEVIKLNVMYTRCSSWFVGLFSINMFSNVLGFIFVSKEQVSFASRIYRCHNHKLYVSRCFEQAPLDVAAVVLFSKNSFLYLKKSCTDAKKMPAFWKSATLEKQHKLPPIKQGCENGGISLWPACSKNVELL